MRRTDWASNERRPFSTRASGGSFGITSESNGSGSIAHTHPLAGRGGGQGRNRDLVEWTDLQRRSSHRNIQYSRQTRVQQPELILFPEERRVGTAFSRRRGRTTCFWMRPKRGRRRCPSRDSQYNGRAKHQQVDAETRVTDPSETARAVSLQACLAGRLLRPFVA